MSSTSMSRWRRAGRAAQAPEIGPHKELLGPREPASAGTSAVIWGSWSRASGAPAGDRRAEPVPGTHPQPVAPVERGLTPRSGSSPVAARRCRAEVGDPALGGRPAAAVRSISPPSRSSRTRRTSSPPASRPWASAATPVANTTRSSPPNAATVSSTIWVQSSASARRRPPRRRRRPRRPRSPACRGCGPRTQHAPRRPPRWRCADRSRSRNRRPTRAHSTDPPPFAQPRDPAPARARDCITYPKRAGGDAVGL